VKLVAWFEIALGVGILGIWTALLATGEVPEIAAGQRDIWFHLAAEGATALLLVGAGYALLRALPRARLWSAFALGALLYTTVNSPGYYADRGDWAPVGMFVVMAAASVVAFAAVLRAGVPAPAAGRPETPATREPAGR
jgi:hypothetical protein